MKSLLSIAFGIIAFISLLMFGYIIFEHPFKTAATNNNAAFSTLVLALLSTALFLFFERLRKDTIVIAGLSIVTIIYSIILLPLIIASIPYTISA